MNFTLKIWRQKNRTEGGKLVTYAVRDISPDASFLEMLDVLNNDLVVKGEDPVAFDHDCREGICGSCSMNIDGRNTLACTKGWDECSSHNITIAPLPHQRLSLLLRPGHRPPEHPAEMQVGRES